MKRKIWLWVEMLALFVAVPGVLAMMVHPDRAFAGFFEALGLGVVNGIERPTRLLMPALFVFTVGVLVWLTFDPGFEKRRLVNWRGLRADLPRLATVTALAALTLLGVALLLHEFTDLMTIERRDGTTTTALLRLPRELPWLVPLILLFYPLFSAYPQEVTHRAFFFHRYRAIFPSRLGMIWASAIVFSWMHAPFWHWMALALTLPGGLLFAWTYDRTESTLAAGLEHGVLGWLAFVVGLGWFVFTGSIGSGAGAG